MVDGSILGLAALFGLDPFCVYRCYLGFDPRALYALLLYLGFDLQVLGLVLVTVLVTVLAPFSLVFQD